MKFIKKFLRVLMPLAALGLSLAVGLFLIRTAPEAQRRPPSPVIPLVETLAVQPRDYPVTVQARGTVTPRTQSVLIAEAAGRIVEIGPHFQNGGFFERDELLARIDPRDYDNAVTVARSEVARTRLALREEEAQAEQARRDWENLDLAGSPGSLTLRQPQMENARAALAAAEARLKQAALDLERTRIRAPFAGRVLEKQVDVGQFVSRGAALATLYAVDLAEARLPISDHQAAFLELPETFRGEEPDRSAGPVVTLSARVGGALHQWSGRIARTEGAIDLQTRQIYVVAQVDDPYARRADGAPPLKVGQFVEAAIAGKTLADVFVIPRAAMRGTDELLLVDAEERIERRRVEIAWRDVDQIVVSSGLNPGDRVVLTPLAFAPNGMSVQSTPAGAAPRRAEADSGIHSEADSEVDSPGDPGAAGNPRIPLRGES